MPFVQFESVGDFIPEPRCSKFAVGLQTEGRKMGGERGPVGHWSKGTRVTGASLYAKSSNVCCLFESLVVRIVGACFSCRLIDPPVGRERIPLYR